MQCQPKEVRTVETLQKRSGKKEVMFQIRHHSWNRWGWSWGGRASPLCQGPVMTNSAHSWVRQSSPWSQIILSTCSGEPTRINEQPVTLLGTQMSPKTLELAGWAAPPACRQNANKIQQQTACRNPHSEPGCSRLNPLCHLLAVWLLRNPQLKSLPFLPCTVNQKIFPASSLGNQPHTSGCVSGNCFKCCIDSPQHSWPHSFTSCSSEQGWWGWSC